MIEASVEVEIPKGFDFGEVEKELKQGLYRSAQSMRAEMKSFVENWQHQPTLEMKSKRESDRFIIRIYPTGENAKYWIWVSFGTKGKVIRPVRAKHLVFPYQGEGVSYAPKTAPWGFRGGAGKKLGPVRKFNAVKWPGITPRQFEEEVIIAKEKEFKEEMDDALEKGLKRAGGR